MRDYPAFEANQFEALFEALIVQTVGYECVLLLALLTATYLLHVAIGWTVLTEPERQKARRRRFSTMTLLIVTTVVALAIAITQAASEYTIQLASPTAAETASRPSIAMASIFIGLEAVGLAGLVHFVAVALSTGRKYAWLVAAVVPAVIKLGTEARYVPSVLRGRQDWAWELPFHIFSTFGLFACTAILCAGMFKIFSLSGYHLYRLPRSATS